MSDVTSINNPWDGGKHTHFIRSVEEQLCIDFAWEATTNFKAPKMKNSIVVATIYHT